MGLKLLQLAYLVLGLEEYAMAGKEGSVGVELGQTKKGRDGNGDGDGDGDENFALRMSIVLSSRAR